VAGVHGLFKVIIQGYLGKPIGQHYVEAEASDSAEG